MSDDTANTGNAEDTVALLVLAKAPHAGKVKTRLCPPATPQQAARIAAAALLDTLDAVSAVPRCRPVVALSGELDGAEAESEIRQALEGIPVLKQRGDSLGERIAAAHLDTAALFEGLPVVQVGMDTPQIDAATLAACRDDVLGTAFDAVLGTAEDGGWWVLGLRDPLNARILEAVPTSRPDTGSATESALREAGLRVTMTVEMSDVDSMADAVAVADIAPHTRFAAAVGEVP